VANIKFTAAGGLNLTGGGGAAGTTNINIAPYAFGDTTAAGTGTSFVTYNVDTNGNSNGIRPLNLTTEYTNAITAGNNVKLTVATNAVNGVAINSLLLTGAAAALNFNANNITTTVTSGAVAETAPGGSITTGGSGNATRVLAFGTTEAIFFAAGPFSISSNVTGTGGLTKTGPGTVTLATQGKTITGGYTVDSGSLTETVANSIGNTNAVTVRAGGTLALTNVSDTIGALNLESGSTSGASVTTGTGTVALGGIAELNVNGSGRTGATIAGLLGLGATRTFTVADGSATNDLSISSVISGAGFGITKAGAGTLALSGVNTYTGVTTINAGVLSANSLANGGTASSIGQSTNVAGNLVLGGGTLQYTGGTVPTDRSYTLTAGTTSSIDVSTAATNLTISGAAANTTGALTKLGSGTLTLSGANLYTGATTINNGTLAYGVNNALSSGAVTVDGLKAVLSLGVFSDTVGTVTVANGGSITGSGTLTSTGSFAMQSGQVSAVLAGAGIPLNKTTSGSVVLSGANTYTGATT